MIRRFACAGAQVRSAGLHARRAMHHTIDSLFGAQSLPGLWGCDANGDLVIPPDELVCPGCKSPSSNIVAGVIRDCYAN